MLDVGCGPGWLSEFLARCGYWVTGVDVSEDMVRIARERIAAIEEPIGPGIEALAEFHAMPVFELPWRERFDAAILYDAMHHFHDEVATLRVIRRTLVPGGRIFIHEGVRPPEGSEGERELIAEMEEYGTLESPFDPDYLVAVLEEAGFTQVTRFAAVDELLDLSERTRELQRIEERIENPPMNTVIAVNPVPAAIAGDAPDFLAQLEPAGSWQPTQDGQELALPITVTNAGRGFWPAGIGPSFPLGTVTLGPYLPADDGERVELPRVPLPRSLSPGESVGAEVRIPAAQRRRRTRGRDRSRSRRDRLVRGLRLVAAGRPAAERAVARVRIVVDVTPLALPRTGIGNYVLGMLRGLTEAGPEHEIVAFSAVAPPGKRRIEAALDGVPVERRLVLVPPKSHYWRTAWSRLGRGPVEWLAGPLDVFHFSDWMYPPQRAGVRATTIHDLVPLRHPDWVHPQTYRMHSRKYAHAARDVRPDRRQLRVHGRRGRRAARLPA